jgi:uncharacterized coiled-coil protein SlyX
MQKLQASSVDIWRVAPLSVNKVQTSVHPFHFTHSNEKEMKKQNKASFSSRPDSTLDNHNHFGGRKLDQANDYPPLTRRLSATDTTVGTTQSPLTRNTAMNNTQMSEQHRRFDEIEAAFIKNHEAIGKATGRMDQLEDRITRTMSACEQLSNQVALMDSRFTSMFEKLETLLTTRLPTQQTINYSHDINDNNNSYHSRHTQREAQTGLMACDASMESSDDDTQRSRASTTSSTLIKSPEKKKPCPTPNRNI